MDVILAILERPETTESLLTTALRLGQLIGGARVQALAVHTPFEAAAAMPEGMLTEEAARLIAATDQDRVDHLHAAFNRVADATPGHTLYWTETEGAVEALVEERGSRADFVVVARPAQEDDHWARSAFRAALFETERPVLVVPPGPPREFGRKIAIAWRDDKRTGKAVLEAQHCLAHAELVHVLAGTREGAPDMPDILREHGIPAKLHALPLGTGVFGQTLLDHAHALGADMLVMGAYVHNPIRRLLLGGVTRFMLDHADIPVLMSY